MDQERDRAIEEEVIAEVIAEYVDAFKQHGNWHSLHEGHSVIEEEYDELWDEIKLKPHKRDYHMLKKEALQLAASAYKMAIFIEREHRRKK